MLDILKRKKPYVILSVLLCFMTVFAITQYKRANELSYSQEIEYNRVFSELTEYVDDLQISLLKGQLVNNPLQVSKVSADLYRQASAAKANLALLPLDNIQLEKTSEFLSQVGEFSNSISMKLLKGEEISDEERASVKRLTEYATQLKAGLDKMLIGINDGEITFEKNMGNLSKIMNKGNKVALEMEALEEEFHNYPSLIYDGPFSQHLTLKESEFVKGKAKVNEAQVKKLAKKFIKDKNCRIEKIRGKLPAYSVKTEDITAEYTESGGILLLYMKDKNVSDAKISISDAKKKAEEFLKENGFSSMKESYYDNQGGSIVINYAYYQDEYMVFPDLVKVKVALDDGEIIGFESRGYVMNHHYRNIPEPKIDKEKALSQISSSLKTQNVTMAIIPLENGSEAPCYQIRGIVADKHFLVYINTQTGYIEDMQILIETEGGTLAV